MKVIVAHPGKQHSMHTAIAFEKRGTLLSYITTVYDKPESITHITSSLLFGKSKKKAKSRKNDNLPNEKIKLMCEMDGLCLLLLMRMPGLKNFGGFFNDILVKRFGRKVAKYAIKSGADALIMYDSTCNEAFRYIKKRAPNIKCILDCSISNRVYNKRVYEEDIYKTGDKVILREQAYLWKKNGVDPFYKEVALSDYFLVASSFVANSLEYAGAKKEQIKTVPYGVDVSMFFPKENQDISKPLQLLYVGGVMRRKGLHHLLKIVSQFTSNEVKLYIAGGFDANYDLYKQYNRCANIEFLGFVTRDKLADLFKQAHWFVLPSLCEGLALVGLEAMASGLPILCSTNTGVNDLVEDYKNGIVFDAMDDDGLEKGIRWALNNMEKINQMGKLARECALNYTWENYYNNLYREVKMIVEGKS